MASSYFKILDVTYKCEKECPCRPENKLTSALKLPTEQPTAQSTAQKKVRFTVVPVTETTTFMSGSPIRSGWF